MIGIIHQILVNRKVAASRASAAKGLGIGTVDQQIDPITGGRVSFAASIWPAFAECSEAIEAGELVRVVEQTGLRLLVKKLG